MDSPVRIGGIVAFRLASARSISEYLFPLVGSVLLYVKVVLIIVRGLKILSPANVGILHCLHSIISTACPKLIRTERVYELNVVSRDLIHFLPLEVVSERLHLVFF